MSAPDSEMAQRSPWWRLRVRPARPPATAVGEALAAVMLGLMLFWTWHDGGYALTTWLAGGVFAVALAAVVLFTSGGRLPVSPLGATALVLLAAFTAWNFLTVLWAGEPADAWVGSNRTLLYLAVFALFVAVPLRPRAATALVGMYTLGVVAVALASVVRATVGADPAHWYIQGRLAAPMDYSNADAALYFAALWPALILSSRREVHPLLRGAFLAGAGILVQAGLLCQSRGSIVAVPVVALLVLAIVPGRLRFLLSAGLVAIVTAVAVPTLLDVYPALMADGDLTAISHSGRLVAIGALVLAAAGAGIGIADRRVVMPVRMVRRVGVVVAVVAIALVLVGSVGFAERYGSPWAKARTSWAQFKAGDHSDERDVHLSAGFGSNRYDLWRVALIEFRREPLVGIGSDNFAAPYLVHRRSSLEEPMYPHSVVMRLLSQTGLVGTALLVAFLAVALTAVWRSRRSLTPLGQAVAVGALAIVAYWLVHGSVDWFWEIPALGAPAFAMLALSLRLGEGESTPAPPARAVRAAIVVAALAGCLSLGAPWVSAKETALAAEGWPSSPALAFDRLRIARALNPLSDQPDVIAAVIAGRTGDGARERQAWMRAVARSPENWYAQLKLGLLAAAAGDRDDALARLRAARAANPREPVLAMVQRRIRAGQTVSAAAVDRLFIARADTLSRANSGHRPGA